MATKTETVRNLEWLLSESNGYRSRKTMTFAQTGAEVLSGTVVGKVTASGKLKAYANANSDGTETAVGILMETLPAATGDVSVTIIELDAEVFDAMLTGIDAAGRTDLLALGIKMR